MSEPVKCDRCNADAIVKCSWGPATEQSSTVCAAHGQELWDACEARVNSGAIPWTNEAVNE